jgi:hypothetical protein
MNRLFQLVLIMLMSSAIGFSSSLFASGSKDSAIKNERKLGSYRVGLGLSSIEARQLSRLKINPQGFVFGVGGGYRVRENLEIEGDYFHLQTSRGKNFSSEKTEFRQDRFGLGVNYHAEVSRSASFLFEAGIVYSRIFIRLEEYTFQLAQSAGAIGPQVGLGMFAIVHEEMFVDVRLRCSRAKLVMDSFGIDSYLYQALVLVSLGVAF